MKSILFVALLAVSAAFCTAAAQDQMGMGGAHTVSVTITNTTAHQAFSAPVLLSHSRDYLPFALGQAVYPELIPLAEDGMTGELETVAKVEPAILDYAVAKSALGPGESVTLQVRVDDAHPLLSAFGMMVTTNDTVFYYGTDLAMSGGSGSQSMGSGSESMSGGSDQMGSSSDSMSGGSDAVGSSSDAMGAGSDTMGTGSDSMGSDSMGSDSMGSGSDAMGSESMGTGSDTMASGSDQMGSAESMGASSDMMSEIDLYDGTVRALDAGSEANTESCHDIPGPPCGNVGVRHTDMAEGTVRVSKGLTGDGDLDPAVYGWTDPVATVRLSTP